MRRSVSALGVAGATVLLGIDAVEGAASATTISVTTPVKVQLRQDASSACWEATYGTASTNTASAFKAKSE